jgi:hypothetical protein
MSSARRHAYGTGDRYELGRSSTNVGCAVALPEHIAERIQSIVASTSTLGGQNHPEGTPGFVAQLMATWP